MKKNVLLMSVLAMTFAQNVIAQQQTRDPLVIEFENPVSCRYLELTVTELGLRANGDAGHVYAQLSEMEIYVGDENVATSASFSTNNTWSPNTDWNISYINDGIKDNDNTHRGWTTNQDPSVPITVTVDLGTEKTIDRILLFPRQDDYAKDQAQNIAANFPAAFTLKTSTDQITYEEVYKYPEELSDADKENFWLPVYSNDELKAGDVIRIQEFGNSGRHLGYSGQSLADGSPLTGSTLTETVPLTITDKSVRTVDGASTPLYTLKNAQLYVNDWWRNVGMLGWRNYYTYSFGFDFNSDGVEFYRINDSGTTRGGGYIYYYDANPASGINANSATSTQKWRVYKQSNVKDDAASRLTSVQNGDQMFLTRTFAEGWNTICLPFAQTAEQIKAAVGDDAEVAAYVGTTSSGDAVAQVCFEVVDALEANKPYLIYVPQEMKEIPAQFDGTISVAATPPTPVAVSPVGAAFSFVGSFENTTSVIESGDYLLSTNSTFVKANGGNLLRPFRAYLKKNDDSSAPARIEFVINGEVTAVAGLSTSDEPAEKNGAVYDLQGRKLSLDVLPKGLYIQNGRKIMIK